MSVIFLVLPLALLVVLAAVLAFSWAARRGQFDDLTTPAWRVLHEDEGTRSAAAGMGEPSVTKGEARPTPDVKEDPAPRAEEEPGAAQPEAPAAGPGAGPGPKHKR